MTVEKRPTSARPELLGAIALGFAVRLVHFVAIARSAIPAWQTAIHQTDYYATWAWATRVRAGDWLGRAPFHPYTLWMKALGSPGDWERWWGGAQVFHQAPLYAYLVALVSVPPNGSVLPLFILQNLASLACIPMVALLATRWAGPRAGALAAFLWALAQTEVALASFLLRDALAMPLLLGALCLLETLRAEAPRRSIALAAGLLFGIGTLERENILLLGCLGIPGVFWLAGRDGERPPPARARAQLALLVAAGMAAALLPVWARNLALHVPMLSLSNRAPETILEGLSLAPGADPVGFHTFPAMRAALEEAAGSSLRMLALLAGGAAHAPGAFARLMGTKLWAWASSAEPTDNVDLAYLVLRSPVLRACLPSLAMLVPAALGVLASVRRLAERRAVGLCALPLLAGPLLLCPVLWRYRAGLLPLLVPFAAIGLDWLWVRRREPKGWAVAAGLSAWLFAGYSWVPGAPYRLGPMGASVSAAAYLSLSQPDAALREVDEYLALVERKEAMPYPALVELRRDIQESLKPQAR